MFLLSGGHRIKRQYHTGIKRIDRLFSILFYFD
jgi:hypothetical protein